MSKGQGGLKRVSRRVPEAISQERGQGGGELSRQAGERISSAQRLIGGPVHSSVLVGRYAIGAWYRGYTAVTRRVSAVK